MKKFTVLLALVLMASAAHAQLTKVVDPATDFEISWDGGGNWTPYTITAHEFTVGAPGKHAPFATFGLNKFECDITDCVAGDTDTLAKWEVDIADPGVATESIWVTGWFHWRIRVEASNGDQDESVWTDMQEFHIKRPKKPPKGRIIKF